MIRLPLALRSPAGERGRLSVLIFHRVLTELDPMNPDEPDARTFETVLSWLREWFNVLPLESAVRKLYDGTLPARALSITFDDGYADNATVAAPILHRLGLPATFFISTGYIDGDQSCMWNDRVTEALRNTRRTALDLQELGQGSLPVATPAQRRAAIAALLAGIKHLPQAKRDAAVETITVAAGVAGMALPRLMMNVDQLRGLRKLGMSVGAHTVSHPILSRIDDTRAWQEIEGGKKSLEQMLGEDVTLFAYPNGVPAKDYGPEHVRMVEACGFVAAVSTAWGAASSESQRLQLPRFTPWDRTRLRFAARMLGNYSRVEAVAA